MAHLVSVTVAGNVHDTVATINQLSIAHFLFGLYPISGNYTVAVYKFDSYPDYVWYCERTGTKPKSTKEFFK